jgi:hypothetical protein
MSITNNTSASVAVDGLLRGMSLDSVRIYSVVVQLGFFRPNSASSLPVEAWITTSGNLRVEPVTPLINGEFLSQDDFFTGRSLAVFELYKLVGKEIMEAFVLESGELAFQLGEKRVLIQPDGGELEEVWAVMSDSPDTNISHQWHVALDDSGSISVRYPG